MNYEQFVICIHHFEKNDLIKIKSGFKLNTNAVPTVFNLEYANNNDCIQELQENVFINESDARDDDDAAQSNCSLWRGKVDELSNELLQMQLQFDMEKQHLMQKIAIAENKFEEQREKVIELVTQLKMANTNQQKLEKEIEDMKRNRYADGENVRTINFCLFIFMIFFIVVRASRNYRLLM